MKIVSLLCLALAFSPLVFAAEEEKKAPEMSAEAKAMMAAGMVGPEHAQLKAMEGKWNTKVTMWMGPEPTTSNGTAVNRAIMDGRFIQTDYTGDFAGEKFTGLGYTGYDNLRKKFVGTWMDSMSTGVYLTHGSYDAATSTYTYAGEFPDFMDPTKSIKVRETVKIDSADQHTMSWYEVRGDKPEAKTMEIVYTRQK